LHNSICNKQRGKDRAYLYSKIRRLFVLQIHGSERVSFYNKIYWRSFVLPAALRLSLSFLCAAKQFKNSFTLPLAMFMFVIKLLVPKLVRALYNLSNTCLVKSEST
jgi:hypothetical protein